ncbi:MAG: hypothetical protein NT062_09650 [Proteobacteria bacterium]|nr:hypothetical protein [Pseudomonadota bacterium]
MTVPAATVTVPLVPVAAVTTSVWPSASVFDGDRRIVDVAHGQRDVARVGVGAVGHQVGERGRPAVVPGRRERDRRADQRDRAVGRPGHGDHGERVAVDVGVVRQDHRGRQYEREVLGGGERIVDGDRRVVHGIDGHVDRRDRRRRAVRGGGGERIDAVVVRLRRVRQHRAGERRGAVGRRAERDRHGITIGVGRDDRARHRRVLVGDQHQRGDGRGMVRVDDRRVRLRGAVVTTGDEEREQRGYEAAGSKAHRRRDITARSTAS